MADTDEFEGRPWNAELTPEWNESGYWTKYYSELMADPDPWRLDHVVHRGICGVLRQLPKLGWLPRPPDAPRARVLDAGCGISLIPDVFGYWGFAVTAVDLCPEAVQLAALKQPTEADLVKCIEWLETAPDGRGLCYVEDPARRLGKLREYRMDGGSVRRIQADWHDEQFSSESFELIHCRNSLRLSPKRYWRQSLRRLHELLAPNGALYIELVNAIGIQDEVEALAREAGFWLPGYDGPYRYPAGGKTFVGWWPTG